MKKIMMLAVLTLLLVSMLSFNVMAGAGDEYYNGEDSEQPAPGAEDSFGPGEPSDAPDTGDRTRNKDN